MLPVFRKEFADLRQREIEESSASIARRVPASFGSRLTSTAAIRLHRLADWLDPHRGELGSPRNPRKVVVRQP
jgi:hypothetical protein